MWKETALGILILCACTQFGASRVIVLGINEDDDDDNDDYHHHSDKDDHETYGVYEKRQKKAQKFLQEHPHLKQVSNEVWAEMREECLKHSQNDDYCTCHWWFLGEGPAWRCIPRGVTTVGNDIHTELGSSFSSLE